MRDDWSACRERKDCACGGLLRPARHTPGRCEQLVEPRRVIGNEPYDSDEPVETSR